MIYFTADEHYFHNNIIKYCGRPFKSWREMNEELIRLHNEIVTVDDTVFHLGDFAMIKKPHLPKIKKVLERLNGDHHLILGNHDEGKPFFYVDVGFISVHTAIVNEEFTLIHDPTDALVLNQNSEVLHEHIHNPSLNHATFSIPNVLNVGVDLWNYQPVSIDRARNAFNEINER